MLSLSEALRTECSKNSAVLHAQYLTRVRGEREMHIYLIYLIYIY